MINSKRETLKIACRLTHWLRLTDEGRSRRRTTTHNVHKPFHTMYFADCKKYSLFLNFTPYFHDCKKLLLSFEFYPLFSRAGGKLLFWKNPSEGSDQYNTRIARDLHTFRYHHTFAKKSLRHYLVQTINNTPDNVFSKFGTHSLNGFSNYVKLNLINNYQDECNIQNCYIFSQI